MVPHGEAWQRNVSRPLSRSNLWRPPRRGGATGRRWNYPLMVCTYPKVSHSKPFLIFSPISKTRTPFNAVSRPNLLLCSPNKSSLYLLFILFISAVSHNTLFDVGLQQPAFGVEHDFMIFKLNPIFKLKPYSTCQTTGNSNVHVTSSSHKCPCPYRRRDTGSF